MPLQTNKSIHIIRTNPEQRGFLRSHEECDKVLFSFWSECWKEDIVRNGIKIPFARSHTSPSEMSVVNVLLGWVSLVARHLIELILEGSKPVSAFDGISRRCNIIRAEILEWRTRCRLLGRDIRHIVLWKTQQIYLQDYIDLYNHILWTMV